MRQNKQKIKKQSFIIASIAFALVFVLPVEASEINPENVIRLVNEARVQAGLKELEESEKLGEVATAKVNDMVKNKYFAHTSPKGLTPWHWFELAGYDYKYAGENLAINFTTAEAEQVAWMNSPTHKKNILNENYQEIGVAVATGEVNGTMGIIAVQEFGTLAKPGAPSGEKDFASAKDKVLPDTTKFVPTVLSSGDKKINENLKNVSESFTKQNDNWLPLEGDGNIFWLVLLALAVLPIVFLQFIFVGRFAGIPWFRALLQENYASVRSSGIGAREYFRKLKVRNYDKYQIVRVRVVTT